MKKEKEYAIKIKMHTGSSQRGIVVKNNEIHLYTQKNPVQGEANSDAIKIISDYYKVPKNNISIIRGEKSRNKVFHIKGSLRAGKEILTYSRRV